MDTDVQKNTADIAALDTRMSSHEAMCEERWKTCFNRFDDIDTSVGRIETILISSAGAIIVGAVTLIFTMWQIHQEKTMEMEYTKKDIKKAPKIKEGVHKTKDGYSFYDKKNDTECTFETKDAAKVAYERIYGKE